MARAFPAQRVLVRRSACARCGSTAVGPKRTSVLTSRCAPASREAFFTKAVKGPEHQEPDPSRRLLPANVRMAAASN